MINYLFNFKNKLKNLFYLKEAIIPSEVLISDGWVKRIPQNRFRRRLGQQITRWSCVPSSIEIINALMFGKDGKRQEDLKKFPHVWQRALGETRHLMPFDKKTALLVMKELGVKFEKVLLKKEIVPEKILIPQPYKEYGWLLFFSRFSLPNKKPSVEHNHATVLLFEKDGKISLKIPAYSLKYKKIKSSCILTYKNWGEIFKREPVNAILVIPLKKNEKPKWSNKLTVWGNNK